MTGPAARDAPVDLAIVLHSHMPYVEGFGTYPFGEEWLFDAFARSHLPVLEVARGVTITATPVLADQLEAGGVGERMLAFLRRHRLEAARRDGDQAEAGLRSAAQAEADSYGLAVSRIEALGDPLGAFQAAARRDQVEMIPSAASHAVLPMLATLPARRLQVDSALRSHRRRFGPARGFWLPECAFRPGLESVLAERGLEYTCLDQSGVEEPLAALAPARTPGGPVAFTLDWPSIELVWSERGYPSREVYLEYHRLSANGTRLWAIGGQPYDSEAARRQAHADAEDFLERIGARLEQYRSTRHRRGLVVFAIDTELLGHWWAEGPAWLAAVIEAAPRHGIRLLTLGEALAAHRAEERPLFTSSWGDGKDLSTWDAPAVADLALGARRLELRLIRDLEAGRVTGAAAERAARELLAVQASDWAFLDRKGQAGDYPYRRAISHAISLLEAIDSAEPPEPRMRNLAPDLSLAPLLEP